MVKAKYKNKIFCLQSPGQKCYNTIMTNLVPGQANWLFFAIGF